MNPFEKKVLKQALLEWRADAKLPLDRILNDTFREYRVGQQQRAVISDAAFLGVRVWPWTMGLAKSPTKPEEIRHFEVFVEDLLSIPPERFFEKHRKAKPRFDADRKQHLLGVHGVPGALLASWAANETTEHALHEYLHTSLEPAPLAVRVNTLKTTREHALERWKAHGARASIYCADGIVFPDRVALQDDELFLNGSVEVQDENSQLVGLLCGVRPGMKVLDLCAGAGGKTLHLAALMGNVGEIHAFDSAPAKLARLRERVGRAGATCVRVIDKTALENSKAVYDLVLIDSPCSSLGTLRRNPDRILKWNAADAQALSQVQSELVLKARGLVKRGGRLAYVTCTIRPQENLEKLATLVTDPQMRLDWLPHPLVPDLPAGFFERLVANPVALLAGAPLTVDSHWIQWGPERGAPDGGQLSGALSGDGFFLALYNRRQ